MKSTLLRWFAAGCVVFVTIAHADSTDVRFSQSLNAEDRAVAGVTRLSSDEIAVVDALVRRDVGTRARTNSDEKAGATFSARLTADERRIAGLPKLTAEELV